MTFRRRINSDCVDIHVETLQRRNSSRIDRQPLNDVSTNSPRKRCDKSVLHFEKVSSSSPRTSVQFGIAVLISLFLIRKLRGAKRILSVGFLWIIVERIRLSWFRSFQNKLSAAALRVPLARQGMMAIERVTSDGDRASDLRVTMLEDAAGHTAGQASFCEHMRIALERNHRWDAHVRPHLLRRGLPDTAAGWMELLHSVVSSNGTHTVRSTALVELQKLAMACGGSGEKKPIPSGRPLWGLAGSNCAWPRPLLIDVLVSSGRCALSIALRFRGYTSRKVYAKVVNADIEYLIWVHPGPRDGSSVPIIFLHGVGAGAPPYGPLLSHLAKQRPVIAVEIPGVSLGQISEAGPAAVLDGLPVVIQTALGPKKVYDIVCHSAGGWWASVVLRSAWRGQIPYPRRVAILQSPNLAPACLFVYMQNQAHIKDIGPAPYNYQGGVRGWLNDIVGKVVFCLFAKEVWNAFYLYMTFHMDELIILPETLRSAPNTSFLFLYGDRDPYVAAHECDEYIRDMMPEPNIYSRVLKGAGHGTFLTFPSEWEQTVRTVDSFLQTGSPP